MPTILLDVFQLTLAVPQDRPDAEIDAMRRILDRKRFQRQLLAAAQAVIRQHPELACITLTLTR